jgi:WD40 repeat protein
LSDNEAILATHYEVLGVQPSAQPEEVRIAYRRLARHYHPDLNPDPKAHEQMAKINVAFEVLSDPVRRMEYDTSLGHHHMSEPGQAHKEACEADSIQAHIVQRHRLHRTPIYSMAFMPGSSRLVSSSFDNELVWWTPGVEGLERRSKMEGGVVNSIQTVGSRRVVAAGSTEQSLACWTVGADRNDVWRQTPKDWICCLKPSPDGTQLAMGQVDSFVRVVAASTGSPRWHLSGHKDSVTALAWSADSSYLATGSADATVKVWCGTTGRELHHIQRIRSTVTSLAFSPDGRWLAAGAVDLSVRVFDLRTMTLRHTFFGHEKPIEGLAFHPRSWLMGSCSRDGTIGLWNIKFGIGHGRIEASHQPLACISFSGEGNLMAAGGLDKVLRVWRLVQPRRG